MHWKPRLGIQLMSKKKLSDAGSGGEEVPVTHCSPVEGLLEGTFRAKGAGSVCCDSECDNEEAWVVRP